MGKLAVYAGVILLGACTGPQLIRDDSPRSASYSLPPATNGILAELAQTIEEEHGAEASGFHALDSSYDGLKWRIALIDSAQSSLDIQTYLWYPDNTGRYVLERAVRAAQRGVKVRLVVDDLLTIGQEALMADLHNQPNIELRLFNPWENRGLLSRAGEMIAEMERLNTRMHNKQIIADGNAVVVGGRNLGDHYFGLSEAYNFHDLDLLGFGPVARQASQVFDSFWNSEWVASADQLSTDPDPEQARARWETIQANNRSAPELEAFPREVTDWRDDLEALAPTLRIGRSRMTYDTATATGIEQKVIGEMFESLSTAQSEVLITNAYIIPGQPVIDFLTELNQRGVRVRILTNSLASHDVPAVNSHYKPWRDDLIHAGVELHEIRPNPAIQSLVDVPPTAGQFVGLHTKAFVVDRRLTFIGSMNFDPRSANINTEGGVLVESEALGEDIARLMERDMEPANAWHVLLDEEGLPYWVSDAGVLHEQPARDGGQRIMDVIFQMFPEEQY